MKKVFAILVCVMMLVSLAACQGTAPAPTTAATTQAAQTSGDAAAPAEPVTMRYIVPGVLGPDHDKVMEAVNKKLADDGAGINLIVEAIDWSVWADKLNLKFTSGEEFDMFHIMQDWIPYNGYFSKGELVDVTDLIDQYGPVVKQSVPQEMWDDSRINGRNYIIPTYWTELAVDTPIFYRDDVFKKYNLKIPESPQDILDAFKTVRADWAGKNKPILNFGQASYDSAVLQIDQKLHRYYSDFPFIVKDGFFQVFQDGTVKSWFESEDFKQDCAFMNQAYKEGIIQPDILSVTFDWRDNYQSNGDWLMWVYPEDYKVTLKNYPDLKPDDLKYFILSPEKDILRSWGIKNCNGVSVTSKHPEGPVKFINWLWSAQDNFDLFAYGIKGVHWNPDPNDPHGIFKINDPTTDENNYDFGAFWMIGLINMIRYDCTGFVSQERMAYTPDPEALNSVAGSFFFDASSVSTEYSNVQAEATKVMTPIVMGVQDYDKYFPAALQSLKTAGLDKLVAEYQKQVTAAIAARK